LSDAARGKSGDEPPPRPYSADLFSRAPARDDTAQGARTPSGGGGWRSGSWPRWLVLGLAVAALALLVVVFTGGGSPASKTVAIHRAAARHRSTPTTTPTTSTTLTVTSTTVAPATTTTSTAPVSTTTTTTVNSSTTTTSPTTSTTAASTTTTTTTPSPAPTTTAPGVRTIVYQISGNSSRVILNYIDSDSGGTGYAGNSPVPNSITVQLHQGSQFKITAVEADPIGTSVTCTVLDNGTSIQQNTANGQYATATCQGTVT